MVWRWSRVAQCWRCRLRAVRAGVARWFRVGLALPNAGADGGVPLGVGLRDDATFTDYENYPAELFAAPGSKQPNRKALELLGAFWNSYALEKHGRPLVLAMAADLAESTNIAGFMKDFGGRKGTGWYERDSNTIGALLPQQITEFTNAGICAGLGTVNFADA